MDILIKVFVANLTEASVTLHRMKLKGETIDKDTDDLWFAITNYIESHRDTGKPDV